MTQPDTPEPVVPTGPEPSPEPTAPQGPPAIPLLDPRDGLPPVVTDAAGLARTVTAFAAGTGPVAVDAERASGYRYGQRAFLVQLRREGAGTALIDPVPLPDLRELNAALEDAEWVLHAASQDLPCLAELGLVPQRLFDTELAGRLLGHARVGLGPLTEEVLGYALEKGHSAVDWSTRPLPEPWLRYAALDVELLVDLRDALEVELREQGKTQWAAEEFAHLASLPAPEPRTDPWRRTTSVHRVRTRRALAIVREMWQARDELARERDISPGRVLPDAAIIDAALGLPQDAPALAALPVFRGRAQRRDADLWYAAISRALALPDSALPLSAPRYDGPPPARSWADRDPAAAERLSAARAAVGSIAEEHGLPTENLLQPEALRRVCWSPPAEPTADAVAAALRALGAREWQVALTKDAVAAACTQAAATEAAVGDAASDASPTSLDDAEI